MDTQKNRITETILLSTHNIGFGGQIRILEHEKRSLFRLLLSLLDSRRPNKARAVLVLYQHAGWSIWYLNTFCQEEKASIMSKFFFFHFLFSSNLCNCLTFIYIDGPRLFHMCWKSSAANVDVCKKGLNMGALQTICLSFVWEKSNGKKP